MPDDVSALQLVLSGDPALFAIVRLSLYVSLSAVVLAALIGIPLGAWIALTRFPGRQGVIVVLNALMGLPPVVVGLAVYLALSRSGPLGSFGLLFTAGAMIIAQTVLVTPIIRHHPAEPSASPMSSIARSRVAASTSRPPRLRGTAMRNRPASAIVRARSAGKRRASSISRERGRTLS